MRVNSNKNVTEVAQFTHLKMLLKPTPSFLLVYLLRGAGGQAARRLASRSPEQVNEQKGGGRLE